MKCPNVTCKSENPSNARFCNQCGVKLETLKKCLYPDCGKEGLPLLAKYCPDCGRPLDMAEPVPPVDKHPPKTPSNKLVEMVKVEGGIFRMGGTNHNDEKPVHTVGLDTYYIGKYPITQREWKAVMGNNPSSFEGLDRPVEQVSWYDAVNFCNKLSIQEGYEGCCKINGNSVTLIENALGYRLPTEAEWEYATRGGNKSRGCMYAGSNNLEDVGWYEGNSGSLTHSVNQKSPNELGLYDMSGNVWEWCWDWKNDTYYAGSSNRNPTGPSTGTNKVYRGGAYCSPAKCCVTSFRHAKDPSFKCISLGFRMVFVCSSK